MLTGSSRLRRASWFLVLLLAACCLRSGKLPEQALAADTAMAPALVSPSPRLPEDVRHQMMARHASVVKMQRATRRPVRDAGKAGAYNSLAQGATRVLVSGTKSMPCVLVKFPNQANRYTDVDFRNLLFVAKGISSGSARDYFAANSYGKFALSGEVKGWYTSANPKSYYGEGANEEDASRTAEAAREAAVAADSAGTNWAQFDNDHDGYVDALWVVHSGLGCEETGNYEDIWSHSWQFSSVQYFDPSFPGVYVTRTDDPYHPGQKIKIDSYIIMPERSYMAGGNGITETINGIGVFCHEFGHALGLPDLYDTYYGGSGLGNASLMAGGSWGGDGWDSRYPASLDPWSKADLGWMTPVTVTTNGTYAIPQAETSDVCYRVLPTTSAGSEYFLVENRERTGCDKDLFGVGLFIYHIDESIIDEYRYWNEVNTNYHPYGVALEEADATVDNYAYMHLFNDPSDRGQAGDIWPNGTKRSFSGASIPSTRSNYGMPQPCSITDIPSPAATMTVAINVERTSSITTDVMVRKAEDAEYIGDDIYGDLAAQTVEKSVTANRVAVYHVRVQNDDLETKDFLLYGTGGDSRWAVKYYNALSGGTDVTAQVTGTGLTISALAPGNSREFRVEVTPNRYAENGAMREVIISASAAADVSDADAVAIDTTAVVVPPLTAVTLSADPASPQPANTPVTLTATPDGGLNVEYAFYLSAGAGLELLRGYETRNTFTWTPRTVGAYALLVYAREVGSAMEYMASGTLNYTVTKPVLTAVTLSAGPASPQLANTPITLMAGATGGTTVEYKFTARKGTTVTVLRDYATGATCAWTPVIAGTYTLVVSAREKGTTATVSSEMSYTVTPLPLTGVKLTANVTSPRATNSAVTLTATPTGGGTVEYRFLQRKNDGAWETIQSYGTQQTCVWTPQTAGAYTLMVQAREAGSGVEYAVAATLSFTVVDPLSSVELSTNLSSPRPTGMRVTLTATADGGIAPVYKFLISTDGVTWTTLRDFTDSRYYAWEPTATGTYHLMVFAREKGDTSGFTCYDEITYQICAPLTAVSLAVAPVGPAVVGRPLQVTATPTGGAVVEYEFWVRKCWEPYAKVREYGTNPTLSWTPPSAGKFAVLVYAREAGTRTPVSQAIYLEVANPLTGVEVSVAPAATPGQFTVKATAIGGTQVAYEFWVRKCWDPYVKLQAFSLTNTATWTPTAEGKHAVLVYARDTVTGTTVSQAIFYTVELPPRQVTLSASPAAGGTVGQPVTLTATTDVTGTVEYQFWVRKGWDPYVELRGYGTGNTATWTPTTAGTYVFLVYARKLGAPSGSAVTGSLSYTVTAAP